MSALNNTATLVTQLNNTETVALGAASQNVADNLTQTLSFSNGTGSAQVDQHWEKISVTLAASATVTYTLSALADSLGRTIPLSHVAALVIQVTSRTAGDFLTVGDPTASLTHPWSAFLGGATQSVKVYDLFALGVGLTDGYAVVASTTDELLVKNSGSNPITFQIGLIGRDV